MATSAITITPQARSSYLALFSISRRFSTSSSKHSSSGQFRRSDFSGHGFTGYYDAGQPTVGPLADAYGAPRITPKVLKQHLDTFVIGQERAKKVLSVAVYNHYQRIQELERREEEEEELLAQQARREFTRHPVEGMSLLVPYITLHETDATRRVSRPTTDSQCILKPNACPFSASNLRVRYSRTTSYNNRKV